MFIKILHQAECHLKRIKQNIKHVVWRLVLIVSYSSIKIVLIDQDLLQNRIISFTLNTELFIDKDVSKTGETLHEECHLKLRK